MADKPVPIRAELVPAVSRYADDVVERCYAIWSTIGGMSGAATARYYEGEVGDGVPVPTPQAINGWAREHGWRARRDEDFQRNHGARLFDLQMRWLAIMDGHTEIMLQVQAGAFDHNPAAGLVRLKAGELAGKLIERGIVPLVPKPIGPKREGDDDADKPRDQREAEAMAAITRKKA